MDNKEIVGLLNGLIETSKDGEFGFQKAAEHVTKSDLRAVFSARAVDCRTAAEQLQALVQQHGGEPNDGGTASGAMHRGWTAVKGTLTGYSDLALLEECERGEDAALESYRGALKEELPEVVRQPIERQYDGVKRNHSQIRALRDQARSAST